MFYFEIAEAQKLIWDTAIIASCRFGADKATNTVLAIKNALNDIYERNVYEHVRKEIGIEITEEDIFFAKALAEANDAISHAVNILKEAIRHAK